MTPVPMPPVLPAPYATPSAVNFATVVGWPDGVTPSAPAGLTVPRAGGLGYKRCGFALGSHTASLGLLFYRGTSFPERYRGGAFVGQHGSWNRAELSGYKVVFLPFSNGLPSGGMEDFLTGFICADDPNKVYDRPCGLVVLPDGSLLVADDAADTIWRVQAAGE